MVENGHLYATDPLVVRTYIRKAIMLPEQLLEIGCSEIGVYYIKIDNGYLLAFFCKIKRHIDGYIRIARSS